MLLDVECKLNRYIFCNFLQDLRRYSSKANDFFQKKLLSSQFLHMDSKLNKSKTYFAQSLQTFSVFYEIKYTFNFNDKHIYMTNTFLCKDLLFFDLNDLFQVES